MRKRPLLIALCVFWMGCVYAVKQNVWLLLAFVALSIYLLRKGRKRIGRGLVLLLIFLLAFLHTQREIEFRNTFLSIYEDGEQVTVWGEIYKEEEMEESKYRLYLKDCYVDSTDMPCNDVMVYTSSAGFQVGSILKVQGKLNHFTKAPNEGGFDSKRFYHSQRVDFYIKAESVEQVGDNSNGCLRWIHGRKEALKEVYHKNLKQPWAGLVQGIVLGDKSDLESEVKELFTESGIVHILTVSGLHVSLLGRGLYGILRKRGLGFVVSALAAGTLLLGYGYLTGNGVSTRRAVGMLLLFMLGEILGRASDMLNSMGGVCLVLLWEKPFLVGYSGLLFSVTALLGIGVVGKILAMDTKRWSGLWMSLGVTMTTLPMVALSYYEVPLYSVLLNCIVIPLLTPVFVCGILGGLLGLIWPWGGGVCLLPCQWVLWLYRALCGLVGRLPLAQIVTGRPPVWLVVVYYGVLALGLWYLYSHSHRPPEEKEKKRNISWYKMALLLGCFLLLALYKKNPYLEITCLDVGQGDGIHISIQGTNLMIDGGSSSLDSLGEDRLIPYFKYHKITKIDYWFVTHADMDHISGLLEVLEQGYPVDYLVVSAYIPRDENYELLQQGADQCGAKMLFFHPGEGLRIGAVEITCLLPDGTKTNGDRNDLSLVLSMKWDGGSGLFAGDISQEVEEYLLQQVELNDVTIYKVSHHGSKYSSSTELLQTINPEIALISAGKWNIYGHPHKDTLERLEDVGATVYNTGWVGQITLGFRKNGSGYLYLPMLE